MTTKRLAQIAALLTAAAFLLGAKGCSKCDQLKAEAALACASTPDGPECKAAQEKVKVECGVVPTPTPPPPDPPPTDPPPTPVECLPDIPWCAPGTACAPSGKPCKHNPTMNPAHCELLKTCEPPPPDIGPSFPVEDPPVTSADCAVWPLEEGASLRLALRTYGKKGFYVEPIIEGSPSTCIKIHKYPRNPNSCHLEGLPNQQRCERFLINYFSKGAGECPLFFAKNEYHPDPFLCGEKDPFNYNGMSCDHFGSTLIRDDPQTKEFEGAPKSCGLQRDISGKPMAGFYMTAHGNGQVQARLPDGVSGASNWVEYIEPE